MDILFGFAAAASITIAPTIDDLRSVPIAYQEVGPNEVRIAVSDSVRAATWDDLPVKPSQPVHVRLACIVWTRWGSPGACVPAALLPAGPSFVDWSKARDASDMADRTDPPAEVQLRKIANARIETARITPHPERKTMFDIRFFDEVIAPGDARPAQESHNPLSMRDITLREPLDPALLRELFPMSALRYSATARVGMTCRVQPSLKLLCRDPGNISVQPSDVGSDPFDLIQSLRFATYQLASTMTLEPKSKSKSGEPVVGRDLTLNVSWQLPDLG